MKTICLFVFVAVIVGVLAVDHGQHQTKPGDIVQWTTSNSKGAATLNQTSHAKQETGFKTSTTTAATTTTTAVDQPKEPAAPAPAAEPAKDAAEAVTTTEAPAPAPAAAAPDAKDAKTVKKHK
ncbi:hypothetical protein ACLKA6_010276 [Drosophila palustris]